MTPSNAAWLGIGFVAGIATWFTQVDAPKGNDNCALYRVREKVATAYVLQPPAQEHLFCPSPIVEKPQAPETAQDAITAATASESQKLSDAEVEDKPRHRRRYRHMRRHRRDW